MHVGREEHVVAHLLGGQAAQRERLRERRDRPRALAGKPRCDEHEQLVDEIGREERGRERRPAFEQQRADALVAERAQLVLERPAAQLELRALGQRATAEREPARLRDGADLASRQRGSSARTVPIPTATASTSARSSCTRRRLSSPETQREPGTVTRPSSVIATL